MSLSAVGVVSGKPQENAVGVRFLVRVRDSGTGRLIPLTSATTTDFIFQIPGTSQTFTRAATVVTGKNGELDYFSVAGDLTPSGRVRLQVHLVLPATATTPLLDETTEVGVFEVLPNLPLSPPTKRTS